MLKVSNKDNRAMSVDVIMVVLSLHKKWNFPSRISLVNVTASPVSCALGHIYRRNPWWKTSFFECSVLDAFSYTFSTFNTFSLYFQLWTCNCLLVWTDWIEYLLVYCWPSFSDSFVSNPNITIKISSMYFFHALHQISSLQFTMLKKM